MKNILVGTDGSDGANRAIEVAAELAKNCGGSLIIVTVVRPLRAAEQEQIRQFTRLEGSATDPTEVPAQQVLTEADMRARQTGLASIKTKLLRGDPAEALINAIQSERADAIVVGRRGHGRLVGLLLGSVSQKLVSLAPCVVLVAP
jgi:nucleotide-binding universal stress UspA family protein